MKAPKSLVPVLLKAEELNQSKKRIDNESKEVRSQLESAFEKHEVDEFVHDDGSEKLLKAILSEQTRVSYDLPTLKRLLPKDVFKKLVVPMIDPKKVEAYFETGDIPVDVLQKASSIQKSEVITVRRVNRQ